MCVATGLGSFPIASRFYHAIYALTLLLLFLFFVFFSSFVCATVLLRPICQIRQELREKKNVMYKQNV